MYMTFFVLSNGSIDVSIETPIGSFYDGRYDNWSHVFETLLFVSDSKYSHCGAWVVQYETGE